MQDLHTAIEPSQATTSTMGWRSLTVAWARATGLALGLVSLAYAAAVGMGDPMLVAGDQEVVFSQVFGMTILGATVGAGLAFASRRWVRRPRPVFLTVTLLAVAGYSSVPFVAAEATSTALWLNGLHIAVAVPVLTVFARFLPATRN